MLWFTRAASWAAVINVLATALGFYVPALTAGWPRATLITTIIVAIAALNVRGIRQSSLVLNVLTVGKLVPLIVFIAVGLFFVDTSRLVPPEAPSVASLSATALLLIFAFGGYEVIPVPAGEARDPRRAVPFALIMTIVIVTIVMTLVQVVALGTLDTARVVAHADGRRRAAVHGRGRRGPDHARGRVLDHGQQRRPGARRLAPHVCARGAGRPAGLVRLGPSEVPDAGRRQF